MFREGRWLRQTEALAVVGQVGVWTHTVIWSLACAVGQALVPLSTRSTCGPWCSVCKLHSDDWTGALQRRLVGRLSKTRTVRS